MIKKLTPITFIALFNVVAFVVVVGFHLVAQTPIYFVNQWSMFGLDYHDFYQASLHILQGESPYLTSRYVTPPLFAFVNLPLAMLDFNVARYIFISLTPFTIVFSYHLVYRALADINDIDNPWHHFSGLLVILLSYPFYFLFERGNMDGVVLLCVCLSLFFMSEKPWLSGLLLALAIHFKAYPVLLLIPLFFTQRWKPLLWTCGWILLFAVLLIPNLDEYFIILSKRSVIFGLFENGSLVNVMFFAGKLIGGSFQDKTWIWDYAPVYAAVIFGILLSTLVFVDLKFWRAGTVKQNFTNVLLYFPFMVALPQTVYHYEFVVLLPLLPLLNYLWKDSSSDQRFPLGIATIGVALTQWQAVALYNVTGNIAAHYIPGFGLLLTMTGISLHALSKWRSGLYPAVS